jgi:hypothetical protein
MAGRWQEDGSWQFLALRVAYHALCKRLFDSRLTASLLRSWEFGVGCEGIGGCGRDRTPERLAEFFAGKINPSEARESVS